MSGSKDYFDFLHKLENDPQFCYEYLPNILEKHPTYEVCLKTISKCAKTSIVTAEKIIKGRFLIAEPTISKSPICAYDYAKNIIKGRWEMGEEAIATDPQRSFLYARNVIYGRFLIGEKAIAQDENLSYRYATEIIKGKLPEEMHNIMLAKQVAA